jgi:hypothetical protein
MCQLCIVYTVIYFSIFYITKIITKLIHLGYRRKKDNVRSRSRIIFNRCKMTNKCVKELVDSLIYSKFTKLNLEYINKSTISLTHLLFNLQRYYKMLRPAIKKIILNIPITELIMFYRDKNTYPKTSK